jgi:hypothetical protein
MEVLMAGMSQVQAAASINAVNQILETATQAAVHQTEKLMKASVQMAVQTAGSEIGKGQNLDVTG